MRNGNDPIFISPRMLPRVWGKSALGDWCARAPRPEGTIGEIWVLHPYNATQGGQHLGRLITDAPTEMLGELGRAPPTLRLVLTGADTGALGGDAPALWRVLEAQPGSTIDVSGADVDRPPTTRRCKTGDTYRVDAAGGLGFSGGVVAVEARANFRPRNADKPAPPVTRLAAGRASANDARIALLREPSLSVELWTLPERSCLIPDGETCHALMALSPGIVVENRPLTKGEVVFIPAHGRNLHLAGAKGRALVVYPDGEPTSIWQRWPHPDPGASALHYPVQVETALADAAQRTRYPARNAPASLAA